MLTSICIYAAAITMVVIGALNMPRDDQPNGCKSAPGMPMFNVTGGSIIMIGLFIREILKRFCECCNDCCDQDKCCRIGGKIMKCGFTLIFDLIYMLVTAVWLIAGTASIVESYRKILGEQITTAFSNIKDTSDKIVSTINLQALNEQVREQSQPQQEINGIVDCDEVLYNLTLVVLIAGWIIIGLAALYILFWKILYPVLCCKPCKDDHREGSIYPA